MIGANSRWKTVQGHLDSVRRLLATGGLIEGTPQHHTLTRKIQLVVSSPQLLPMHFLPRPPVQVYHMTFNKAHIDLFGGFISLLFLETEGSFPVDCVGWYADEGRAGDVESAASVLKSSVRQACLPCSHCRHGFTP